MVPSKRSPVGNPAENQIVLEWSIASILLQAQMTLNVWLVKTYPTISHIHPSFSRSIVLGPLDKEYIASPEGAESIALTLEWRSPQRRHFGRRWNIRQQTRYIARERHELTLLELFRPPPHKYPNSVRPRLRFFFERRNFTQSNRKFVENIIRKT